MVYDRSRQAQQFSYKGALIIFAGVFLINFVGTAIFGMSSPTRRWAYIVWNAIFISSFIAYMTVYFEKNKIEDDKKFMSFMKRFIFFSIAFGSLTFEWSRGVYI